MAGWSFTAESLRTTDVEFFGIQPVKTVGERSCGESRNSVDGLKVAVGE